MVLERRWVSKSSGLTRSMTPPKCEGTGSWHYIPMNSTRDVDLLCWNKGQECLSGHKLPCWKENSSMSRVTIWSTVQTGTPETRVNWDYLWQTRTSPIRARITPLGMKSATDTSFDSRWVTKEKEWVLRASTEILWWAKLILKWLIGMNPTDPWTKIDFKSRLLS